MVTYDKTDFSCCHPPSNRDLRFPETGGSFRENHVATTSTSKRDRGFSDQLFLPAA